MDIEFIGENQRKEMTTKGTATVQLPTKQIPEWAKPSNSSAQGTRIDLVTAQESPKVGISTAW